MPSSLTWDEPGRAGERRPCRVTLQVLRDLLAEASVRGVGETPGGIWGRGSPSSRRGSHPDIRSPKHLLKAVRLGAHRRKVRRVDRRVEGVGGKADGERSIPCQRPDGLSREIARLHLEVRCAHDPGPRLQLSKKDAMMPLDVVLREPDQNLRLRNVEAHYADVGLTA